MSLRVYKTISFMVSVAVGLAAAFIFVGGVDRFVIAVSAAAPGTVGTPSAPVQVRFSGVLADPTSVGRVSIVPAHPVLLEWRDGRTLVITPKERWKPGGRYRISFPGGRDGAFRHVSPADLPFSVPEYPVVTSFLPVAGTTDVRLDIEDPIEVAFDRSAADLFIDFRLSPNVKVVYENEPDKTAFRILPQEPLSPDTEYVLSVYAKWNGESDETFRFLGETRFRTIALEPESWEQDLSLRVAQAVRYAHAVISEGKYIDIRLDNQIMTLFLDGRALDAYPVSSGKPRMETPKGTYRIENKAIRPWSARYGLYMPYWMALVPDGKFGIHELPEWPGGYKEGTNHLGIPVSHGCIRLGVGAAKRVFEWAETGTAVVIR